MKIILSQVSPSTKKYSLHRRWNPPVEEQCSNQSKIQDSGWRIFSWHFPILRSWLWIHVLIQFLQTFYQRFFQNIEHFRRWYVWELFGLWIEKISRLFRSSVTQIWTLNWGHGIRPTFLTTIFGRTGIHCLKNWRNGWYVSPGLPIVQKIPKQVLHFISQVNRDTPFIETVVKYSGEMENITKNDLDGIPPIILLEWKRGNYVFPKKMLYQTLWSCSHFFRRKWN